MTERWVTMVEKACDKEPEYIGDVGLAFTAKLLARQHRAFVRMVKEQIPPACMRIYAGDKYIAAVSSVDTPDWDEVIANARKLALFGTHGPHLVGVLKEVACMECFCGDDSMERCPICKSKTVLLLLDQEATCQK